jgi:hypothetical protein
MEWHPFYYKGEETNIEVNELGEVRRVHKDWMKNKTKNKLAKLQINKGYYAVGFITKNYVAKLCVHKIMAMVFFNHKPSGMDYVIDHIDRDSFNNNINNLRIVRQRKNAINRKNYSIYGTGVQKQYNRYRANIQYNSKSFHLGMYSTPEEASAAYYKAEKQIEANMFSPETFFKKI